jgi:hypothetical protein
MEVRFLLHKRDFFWMGFVVVLIGFGVVYAYGGNDPSVMGHSWNEIGDVPVAFLDGVIDWNEIQNVPSGFADGVDDVGGGGVLLDLVNGLHSSDQCIVIAGEIFNDDGNSFCKFGGSTCPSGWIQYRSWSSTSSNKCSRESVCRTPYHNFMNKAIETCKYCVRETGWVGCIEEAVCYANVVEMGCY